MIGLNFVLESMGDMADMVAELATSTQDADAVFAAEAQQHADNLRAFLSWWASLPSVPETTEG